ncbi:hypothetical protein [Peribacillus muralis]|uniref:hypothetical protein n=1 Tax=Peribacillus muralis TaxID=264697 RepID=UPI00366DA3D8
MSSACTCHIDRGSCYWCALQVAHKKVQLGLLVEIEKYISDKGLTYSDSIESLIEALGEA